MDEILNGNFIEEIIENDLNDGTYTHVHTRFPPEPNGYLHIGSAKAIWINHSAARKFGGKFNLRYDDTNPAKEDQEFVDGIIEDLAWLGYKPTNIFFGSDYFENAISQSKRGGTQKFIALSDIRKLEIEIPPIELQNKFAELVKQIDKQKFEIAHMIFWDWGILPLKRM